MKLKTLELANIRSYKQAKLELPDGVLLFEGDIGSGKSTLLYAIEFALFGLGDLKSEFLLRNDARDGFVRLAFKANGRDVVVERTLERKGGKAGQGTGWVSIDGVKTEYAPEELKKTILKVLEFNENPSAKSTSWIYRYAVFTPQEEMKAILTLRDEERLQTLRKAFGIEEYKQARENSDVLSKRIKSRVDFLNGAVAGLDDLKAKLNDAAGEAAKLAAQASESRRVEAQAKNEFDSAETEKNALNEEKTRLQELSAKLPLLERELSEKSKALAEGREQSAYLQENTAQIEEQISQMKVIEDFSGELKIRDDASTARKKVEACKKEIDGFESRAKDYADLIKKGECPTCEREVAADGFDEKIALLRGRVAEKEEELARLREKEAMATKRIEDLVNQKAAKGILDDLRRQAGRNKAEKNDLDSKIGIWERRVPELEKEIAVTRTKLEQGKGIAERVKSVEETLLLKKRAFNDALAARSRIEAQLNAAEKSRSELEKQLREKEAFAAQLKTLSSKRNWLEEVFAPALESIEKHVLGSINSEFNSAFQKHFTALMESSEISVLADEKFTPVVSLSGYEEDYRVLSGGEKSALALAYRLALNEVVKANCTSMRENLLILDEPTDGFSKEQLQKIGDVLAEVNAQQVLLVSHERELESFADKIYRIKKQGSVSTISA